MSSSPLIGHSSSPLTPISSPQPLHTLVKWLDQTLRITEIPDYPNAYNGLQLENTGKIFRLGAAVDACEAVLKQAVQAQVNCLIVHHGLFWQGLQRLQGAFYRKIRYAIENDLAIYSAHLPLDEHPLFGNNALLAQALGIKEWQPFVKPGQGWQCGLKAQVDCAREEWIQRVERAVGGKVHLAAGGPETLRSVCIITGGGGDLLPQVAAEGVDTFLTGEGAHWTYPLAEELGVNLIYAGHYATETFGVKAIAAELSEQFSLPWQFFDHPTGL